MKYRIESERLVMTINDEERRKLKEARDADPDRFNTNDFMMELFGIMTADDCFFWIGSDLTGDMTDAPMLAILGDEEEGPRYEKHEDLCGKGLYLIGSNGTDTYQYLPILYRWAFMDYQVSTPQEHLLVKGEAVWTGGEFLHREDQMDLSSLEGEAELVLN